MKSVGLWGSTGSIGTQAVEIIAKHPDKLKAKVLTCGKNIEVFKKQLTKLNPEVAVINSGDNADKDALALSHEFPHIDFTYGDEALKEATKVDFDIMLNAQLGISGLGPTYEAILSGKTIAISNKETLVTGGEIIVDALKNNKGTMIPVDSEHSAIFQCIQGSNGSSQVQKIFLTASGGPFRGYSKDQLKKVTLKDALKHPNWTMGQKITIDSATLMNKGLEVIEARWLFDIQPDNIQVVVHPQSIIHSMVEYEDGAVLAQLGAPDMKVPISYSLSYPERWETTSPRLDFFELEKLTFEKPDMETFGCLRLAFDAIKNGGTYPTALNAANEVLVQMFLEQKIEFLDIEKGIEEVLNKHQPIFNPSLEEIFEVDKNIRAIL